MENKNTNLQNDNQSIPSEALMEMESSTNNIPNPSDTLSEMDTSNSLPKKEVIQDFNINEQLNILYEIERMMGQYLDSMKIVDQAFAQVADVFFNNANTIAAKKKEPTENEIHELIASIIIGGAIKGFGNIWQNLKTSQKLANIKSILAEEADAKLDSLRSLKEINEAMWDIALNQFKQSTNFHECGINFQNFRVQQYILDLNYYLIDVYQEALNGRFTNQPFPSYYNTNKHILLHILSTTGEASSETAKAKEASKSITKLVGEVKESLRTNTIPSVEEYVLAADEQIMAVAIDLYVNDDFIKSLDKFDYDDYDEAVYPHHLKRMELFDELYGETYMHPNSYLSDTVRNNNALSSSLLHSYEASFLQKDYERRNVLYNLNCLVIGTAFFLVGMVSFDIAWYWCLLFGIFWWVLALIFTPFKSWRELCQYKSTCIAHKLAFDCRKISGHIETTNLHEISSNNYKFWLYMIIGAIVGLISPIPFGWLIGAIIGSLFGKSINNYTPIDYDYTTIRLGYTWKAQTISAFFTALTVISTYMIIFNK